MQFLLPIFIKVVTTCVIVLKQRNFASTSIEDRNESGRMCGPEVSIYHYSYTRQHRKATKYCNYDYVLLKLNTITIQEVL